ncbi:hypothetical protein BpHYR1_009065 [Brachionus plicatilis]|uniref:Uncharacterized protein n=1 Tax=Brachionus plicatilis TaxID=10195 RepID=A0A3M7QNC6_BRAPC|nr:hypothetical protein BpHYR1_009065 [Brachionus plicatilis]
MTWLITSQSVTISPYFSIKSFLTCSKSSGAKSLPGLASYLFFPFRILLLSGSGNPPGGCPIKPCMYSTTEVGKDKSSALLTKSSLLSLFCTINWAKSPTILDEGVTFMMSPSSWFASAKAERLELQVGVLTTGYFIHVDISVATLHCGCALEWSVQQAGLFPVRRVLEDRVEVYVSVSVSVLQGGDHSAHGRLRGHAGH